MRKTYFRKLSEDDWYEIEQMSDDTLREYMKDSWIFKTFFPPKGIPPLRLIQGLKQTFFRSAARAWGDKMFMFQYVSQLKNNRRQMAVPYSRVSLDKVG